MNPDIESQILGIGFSIFHLIFVALLLKLIKDIAPVLIHAISGAFNLILLSILSSLINIEFWFAFTILAFTCSSYLFAFGALYKSLSLRVLSATYLHGNTMTFQEINTLITAPTFRTRADLLVKMKAVTCLKGTYALTKQGEQTAIKLTNFRLFFRIRTKAIYEIKQGYLIK